ncbi:MAG: hypothetical protein HYY02_12295 [Chloroflexi bacterium]|nr:hypothetical protein [Chloroflexota bacterium]
MWVLEERIQRLKGAILQHTGKNVADAAFSAEVEALLSAFYDDIGEIKSIPLRSLFDLFLIKTLYVNRHSTDGSVIDYLSGMMAGFLLTRDLFPLVRDNRRAGHMLSDLLDEMQSAARFPNRFEAYRKLGDYSLFITGVFPASLRRRRRNRWRRSYTTAPTVDIPYHVSTGRSYYEMASRHELAEATQQRALLAKLASYFEIYMSAMNEASERYILGFDMNLIADKMLDCFNRYRRTGDPSHLDQARKYAAILKVDRASFPSLWRLRRTPRATLL